MILYFTNKFIITIYFEIKKINYIEMHIFFMKSIELYSLCLKKYIIITYPSNYFK